MENHFMKYNLIKRATTLFAMTAAAIFALGFTTVTAAPAQGKATVVSVKGDAQYSTGGAWQALKAGMTLMSGSVIQTADGAEVNLDMGPSGVIKVEPSSTVAIDKLTVEKTAADTITETQLDVRKGKIAGKVNKQSAASRYEIKTPTGVAGIRGTTFSVASDGTVSCSSGTVIAAYVDAAGNVQTFEIPAGKKYVPGTGVVDMSQAEIDALNAATDKIKASVVDATADGRQPGNYFNRPGTAVVFVDPLTSQSSPSVPAEECNDE